MRNSKVKLRIILTVLPWLMAIVNGYAQEIFQVSRVGNFGRNLVQQEFYNTGSLSYLLFMPEDISAQIDGKFPLLVSLHGIGDRGNNVQLLKRDGLPQILDGYRTFPFFVLSPQCPEWTEWYYDRTDTITIKLIAEIIEKYPVDPNRVYITGYSMGGIGSYDLAIRYPEMFAAALPIAARGESYWRFCDMKEVPTWSFHGNLDPLVPLHRGQFIVSVLQNCGCNIKFTVYNGVYHDSWSQTYENPAVYEWLLHQSKAKTRAVVTMDSLVFYGAGNHVQVANSRSLLTYARKFASLTLPEQVFSLQPVKIGDMDYLIVGSESSFHIIDVRQPNSMQVIASVYTQGVCEGLANSGNSLFVAAGAAGLQIYDLRAPTAPIHIATVDSLSYCENVFIDGSFIYVAAGAQSHILEISHPAVPVYLSGISGFGGYHKSISVRDGHAFICDFDQGLQIVDVSNPFRPMNVVLRPTGRQTAQIRFQGNYAYVANGYDGLRIIDFSDIHNPIDLSRYDTPGQAISLDFGALTIANESVPHVWVADLTGGMLPIDISDPRQPGESGGISVQPPANTAYGTAFDVRIAADKAYLAYGEKGLCVVDISRPEMPHLLGTFATTGNFRDVAVKGDFVYVADIAAGLRVLHITNPKQIAEIKHIPGYKVQEITCVDDRIYLAAGDSGVVIFDIADQANPARLGAVSSVAGRAVAVAGVVLGISDYQRIHFFDISNPAHPVPVGETAPLVRGNEGFVITGNLVYVPDGDTLRIFDIANLSAPIRRGVVYTGGYGYEVAVQGQYAYLAADRRGLRVIDVSDADQPREVGYYDDVPLARGIAADSHYIYVAERENGLSIYRNDLVSAIRTESHYGHPTRFTLRQNYPNPFNPVTTIAYELGAEMQVTLAIYNILGQRLLTLIDARQKAGHHQVQFDASTLGTGIYFYRLQAGNLAAMKKMLMLK